MKSYLAVAGGLVLASIVSAPPAVAIADFGKISGTVSIATSDASNANLLPAGLIVEVRLSCSQPGAKPATCGSYLMLTKKSGPQKLSFVFRNVPFAPTQVAVSALVRSVNTGTHYFEHALQRTDVTSSDPGTIVLNADNPTYDATQFAAHGIRVPADATADGRVPFGRVVARIDVRRAPNGEAPSEFPEIIDTFAYEIRDITKTRIGTTTLGTAPSCPDSVPCAQLTIDELPLDTTIDIGILNHGEGIPEFVWHARSSKGRRVDGESCPIVLHLNSSIDSSCSFVGTPKTNGPIASPTPEPVPSLTTQPTASPTPEATASPTPEPTASPTPEPTASPTPEPTASSTPEPTASSTPEPKPSPTPSTS